MVVNSNKKLSRIGIVLLLLITPPMTCNFFSNNELDTINFILFMRVSFLILLFQLDKDILILR
ncbi:Hypothetical protein Ccan_07650 [Capnocytophaga canimorsus Cc5]|uniref:Uncharacterized protein n=1 Tax=Capnocytophaga canimorsus (strain 5) TaxID=860228 RepID=F9YTU9_CAPCC|nr:Hypothetical protein Ccan_07650 [Capnocytophaga canimorsus Cc5]